jgi:hypothetical protein
MPLALFALGAGGADDATAGALVEAAELLSATPAPLLEGFVHELQPESVTSARDESASAAAPRAVGSAIRAMISL